MREVKNLSILPPANPKPVNLRNHVHRQNTQTAAGLHARIHLERPD